ncbi:unnamed protein product [Symbiodinium natans]|uniref:Glutathione peroxidase n=1 Tax=Symbiodinium natans TaxID=878477 RepID=A0A812P2P8_9DINO|nr:unnamed protein product [Symbiodinium natans]
MALRRAWALSALASALASSLYDLTAVDVDGKKVPLALEGNVSVVINVATN